jgi:hypothetical protein
MKKLAACAALLLSGCISIDVPGVVSDTVKATKDIYKETTTPKGSAFTHTYVGKDNQTVAEIKQSCETEAARKLNEIAEKEIRYTVLENEIGTVNSKVVANCKLAVAK